MLPRHLTAPVRGARRSRFHLLGLAAAAAAFAAPLAAQSTLCLERDGKFEVVRQAEEATALVQENGKWERYKDGRFVLQPAEEYLPVVIAVYDPYFKKGMRAVSDEGPLVSQRLVQAGRFVFTANLEAPVALDHVVLALVLTGEAGGDQLFLWGVGHLAAREQTRVSVDIITETKLRGARLHEYHFFVDGREALNTHLHAGKREQAVRQMVASRLRGVRDAAARPLLVADPVYPSKLKSGTKGRAVIRCRVDAEGEVGEPVVKEATEPAFGAAALEAVKQWRFVPAVKGGVAVDSEVEVPVDF